MHTTALFQNVTAYNVCIKSIFSVHIPSCIVFNESMQQFWFRNHTGAFITNFYHSHIQITPWLIPDHHLLQWYFTRHLLPLGMLNGKGRTRLQSWNDLCNIRGYRKLNNSIRETKRYMFSVSCYVRHRCHIFESVRTGARNGLHMEIWSERLKWCSMICMYIYIDTIWKL